MICAAVNVGTRKSVTSNIGFDCRHSTSTNATVSAAAATNSPTMRALPQCQSLPRSSASTNRNSPADNVTNPGMS